MLLSEFDFILPEASIALRPVVPRDAAKLLLVTPGQGLVDLHVTDLVDQLRAGDVLVLNNTRVIPARLKGVRQREATSVRVEATLHLRKAPNQWNAFMRPGKRLAIGDRILFGDVPDQGLAATVIDRGPGGERTLEFELSGPELDRMIQKRGEVPLPPYIASKRQQDARDRADYQTTYAQFDGSVAAPTAGLHFTPELVEKLKAKDVEICFVTLHVGAGTFLPVVTEDIGNHHMHAEYGEVSGEAADMLNVARERGSRVICVGTTSLRLVESAVDESGQVQAFAAETSIFITPGYSFKVADGLMTNFHLPKSTLFVLVSAFAGTEVMKDAYAHAIAGAYRFYSYGDASLLWRAQA